MPAVLAQEAPPTPTNPNDHTTSPPPREPVIPTWLFATGFLAGLLIAFACLGFAIYQLINFQGDVHTLLNHPNSIVAGQDLDRFTQSLNSQHAVIIARIGLRSAALSLGVGFLFLGFSLFLLGVQGASDAEASANGFKLSVTRLAPGGMVILCAAVITLVSAVQPLVFKIDSPDGRLSSGVPLNEALDSSASTISNEDAIKAAQIAEKKRKDELEKKEKGN